MEALNYYYEQANLGTGAIGEPYPTMQIATF